MADFSTSAAVIFFSVIGEAVLVGVWAQKVAEIATRRTGILTQILIGLASV
jgi:hypothetical protein